MKVVIIGSGNVATVLGRKMLLAGHDILQVISRDIDHARALADELKSEYTSALERIDKGADLYMIAVSDHQLSDVAQQLSLNGQLVVHTAGSFPMGVLHGCSNAYGVLYPLQSLRKEIKNPLAIPLLVDANTEAHLNKLYEFASSLSNIVEKLGDKERLHLHVSAIMVNNFANHLYALTEAYCQQEKVDFKLLLPLINETASRLKDHSPSKVQTGPAVRNDIVTIQKHLKLLADYPELLDVYKFLTQSIIKASGR
jgi:predicted short-subunit dehydrogenase-like oxidoreductase (DUF2520 family)